MRVDAPHDHHQSILFLPHWTSFMESATNQVAWVPAIGELYYRLNHISLDFTTTLLERALVNGSARFFSDFAKSRITILPNMHCTCCRRNWYTQIPIVACITRDTILTMIPIVGRYRDPHRRSQARHEIDFFERTRWILKDIRKHTI